ncbi:glycosyl transferase [bacterium]|nr:glycosyl transferase [bacterium]
MSEQKIPKKIHYCWIGGKPIPEHNKKIMESWKKFCPDYEIIEWNESNYDFTKNRYMKEAFENKQWAFAPDYARLDIIYEHGGIYLDTDVELVKPLDDLLNLKGFMGIEHGHTSTDKNACAPGLGFGAIPKLPIIKELRDYYEQLSFVNEDGTLNKLAGPAYQTRYLLQKGLVLDNSFQEIDGLTIFPAEYFAPKEYFSGKINLTENTYSIHHFDASWVNSGTGSIRKDKLDSWGITLTPEEEKILYTEILYNDFNITTKHDLFIAANIMNKIFSGGNQHFDNDNLYKTLRFFVFKLSDISIKNKITSLNLYFTTFRRWKIFETPRANLRYIYHCCRNLLHL